ncbi:PorT family protein [Sphingobacteriales bacterium UPWRP_1]|nr:hypothetical protein B6N25_06275 [Sphingobacteriales bacterium TSM_CSS]PSJ74747.1 PorT family protein [Sphingobacteriales bacterium UPWRP_1]
MYPTNIRNFFALHGRKVVVTLLLCLPLLAQAQKNMPNHDNKRLHFGISLGFNSSKFRITHSDAFTYHDSIKVVDSPRATGFNVGIISDLHLGPHAELRFIPSLIFTEKNLRYTLLDGEQEAQNKKTIESIILGFPVSLKYKSDRFFDNFRFYGLLGGRFDWDLGSNSKARKANDIVKIDRYDVSVEYGVGLEFYFPLFIFSPEIKFATGIPNLHVPTDGLQFSDVLGKLRSRGVFLTLQFEG